MAAPGGDPQHLSHVLSQLINLRGLARVRGDAQLAEVWKAVAGPEIAAATRVLGIQRGALQIGVSNSSLLSELVSFHRFGFLEALQRDHAHLKIREIKFKLKSGV